MLPSASTASSPSTCARMAPWRSTCVPPALVAISPPTVATPLPPSVRGKRRPALAAASCRSCSTTPAPQVIWRAAVSTGPMAFIRRSETSRDVPLASGVAPPDMLLLPPCGTMVTRLAAHSFTSADSSAVLAGEASANAAPV